MSRRRRAAAVLQAFKFVELPAQFVLSIVAARALPASDFGVVAILISVQSLYVALSTFGFDELLQRSLARSSGEQDAAILATAFRARAVSVALGFLLGGAVAALLAASGSSLAVPVLLMAINGSVSVAANGYESIGLARYAIHATSFAALVGVLVPIGLVLAGVVDTTVLFMGAILLGSLARLGISILWHAFGSTVARGIRRQLADAPVLLDTPSDHASLVAFGITNIVLQRHGDVFIAGIVGISAATVGAYAFAYQITAACNQVLLLGMGALGLTRLSEYHADPLSLGRAWRRLSVLAATLAVGPLSIIVLIAPELVHATVGNKYPDLVPLIYALSATQWAARVGGGGTNMGTLIAANESGYVARSALVGAGLNLSLDLALSPWLGVYGLAIGTAVSALAVGSVNMFRIVTLSRPRDETSSSRPRFVDRRHLALVPLWRLVGLTAMFALALIVSVAGASLPWRMCLCAVIVATWLGLAAREILRG